MHRREKTWRGTNSDSCIFHVLLQLALLVLQLLHVNLRIALALLQIADLHVELGDFSLAGIELAATLR